MSTYPQLSNADALLRRFESHLEFRRGEASLGVFISFEDAHADAAISRVRDRMHVCEWTGHEQEIALPFACLDPLSRRQDEVPVLAADIPELLIVDVLADLYGRGQFSVEPDFSVFAVRYSGYHAEDRLYIGGLSPLVDDAARLLLSATERGGRIGARTEARRFFRTTDRSPLAEIRIA